MNTIGNIFTRDCATCDVRWCPPDEISFDLSPKKKKKTHILYFTGANVYLTIREG